MTQRIINGQRLAYYCDQADRSFWDSHWEKVFDPGIYKWAEKGVLSWFEKPFTRYLPTDGPILEAGCGMGQYVLALRIRGYHCEGVEYAEQTVKIVRALRSDIPIREEDACNLSVPDRYYRGYISIGVIEHRLDGPEPFLREAYRVLADDGTAYISVPCFNGLRQVKARLGLIGSGVPSRPFYQYAFTEHDMEAILHSHGFRVIAVHHYDTWKGLKDEIPPIKWIARVGIIERLASAVCRRMPWMSRWFGHMVGFVMCKDNCSGGRPSG